MAPDYLHLFSRLRTDRSAARWPPNTLHRAPHKPLLLLAVIDLTAQGSIKTNLIRMDAELAELFTLYWSRAMPPSQRGNPALPFFHLRSDGFWHLLAQPGFENSLTAIRQIQSVSQLEQMVVGAYLDEALYEQLLDNEQRDALRSVLIRSYFAGETQQALLEQGHLNIEAFHYSQTLLEKAKSQGAFVQTDAPSRSASRNQGFRRAIVTTYDHLCAFCGIRMLTADGHTAVDAAHIIPWRVSRNDDPRNGMALCQLCHWTFDKGLIGVSSKYRVKLSVQLTTPRNTPGHLIELEGRSVHLPKEELLWPNLSALAWHNKHVFLSR